MALSDRIPGMKPGSRIRNVIVGIVWVFVLMGVLGAVLGGGGDTGDTQANTNGNSGGAQSTPTATEVPTYSVGDTVIVGDGEKTAAYIVTGVETAESVGSSSYGEEADGIFVIVSIEIENQASESFDISSGQFNLVDSQDRAYEIDSDAAVHFDDSIIYEQVDPGVTKTGTLVYDVPTDQSGRELSIDPAGYFSAADEKFVELEG